MRAITIGREALADIETGSTARNDIKQRGPRYGTDHLDHDIGGDLSGRETAASGEPHGHGGIEVAAGDMTDGIGHRHDAQPERQRYAQQSNTDLRKRRRDHGAAAAREGQPKRPDRLGQVFFCVHGDFTPLGAKNLGKAR